MLDLEEVNPLAVSWNSRLIRNLAGFAQIELAEAAGISHASVRRVEEYKGKYPKPHALAVAWACYRKISDDDLDRFNALITEPICLQDEWEIDETPDLSPLDIFGLNLKKIRFRFNLTQGQLAALCEYHNSYISAVEMCKQPMTEAFMTALDKVFMALAIDDPDLMNWYDLAKRNLILGDDPPRYSRVEKS